MDLGLTPERRYVSTLRPRQLLVIRDPLVLLIYLRAVGCRRFPVSGAVVAYFLLLSSFTLLALFQMIAVGQLDSVRSAKNAQPI
jgi:predicted ABC-type exoprotein transport system permease subunit